MVCDNDRGNLCAYFYAVLILILLEYGLRHKLKSATKYLFGSLNPYSIGIWSATMEFTPDNKEVYGLNPYSIGIWSATSKLVLSKGLDAGVLILILLEYGLRPCASSTNALADAVLILILLEYGLRHRTRHRWPLTCSWS